MAKAAKENAMSALLQKVAERTKENVVKTGNGGGRTTYLDRFVGLLTDESGQPLEPKDRLTIIQEMSAEILTEDLEAAGKIEEFELTEDGTGEFDVMLANINRKVKAQIANVVADNNNNTSLSFNPAYKNKYEVIKEGKTLGLKLKEESQD